MSPVTWGGSRKHEEHPAVRGELINPSGAEYGVGTLGLNEHACVEVSR